MEQGAVLAECGHVVCGDCVYGRVVVLAGRDVGCGDVVGGHAGIFQAGDVDVAGGQDITLERRYGGAVPMGVIERCRAELDKWYGAVGYGGLVWFGLLRFGFGARLWNEREAGEPAARSAGAAARGAGDGLAGGLVARSGARSAGLGGSGRGRVRLGPGCTRGHMW